MAVGEFGLIERFFTQKTLINSCNRLGVGDDCALLSVPDGYELAVTTDTMVENVHFFPDVDPYSLGYKLLAVNLSDLASMGAEPIAITLALTLPKVDENWLSQFSAGLLALAQYYHIDLIGGDTTTGALTLTVQAMGIIPQGKALKRSTAQAGDLIYLTGYLGDAGLGLKIKQGQWQSSEQPLTRFNQPTPRIDAGLIIGDYANACIDLSDGLNSDLSHILNNSGVGATINWESLPLSAQVLAYIQQTNDWQMPLIAGDDYELCFTIPPENQPALEQQLKRLDYPCQCIGFINAKQGLRLLKSDKIQLLTTKGFEHFVS